MSDFEIESLELEPKKVSIPEVVTVSETEFESLKERFKPSVDIGMYETKNIPEGENALNDGAAPCLILWEFDAKSGKMIRSAHYPEVDKDRSDRFTRMELARAEKGFKEENPENITIPVNQRQIDYFAGPIVKGYDDYVGLVDKISEDVSENIDVHIFLFGQNGVYFQEEPKRSETIVRDAIEHHQVTHQLVSSGVNELNIHDFRSPTKDGGDNTLYVAEENKIYFYHRNNKRR